MQAEGAIASPWSIPKIGPRATAGEDALAAELMGMPVNRLKLVAFAFGAAIALHRPATLDLSRARTAASCRVIA